ncbi:MAG: hypothetical protein AMXMBFR84_04280 [Candidatus Hydrogenedentota bacterium]
MKDHQDNEFDRRRGLLHGDLNGSDLEAFRFVKSWHRLPLFQEALWYKGVNAGEAIEHSILERIAGILGRDHSGEPD